MTSYIDDFPGLIHFIFIDRHFHQITAPSLNISGNSDAKNLDATNYLKQKVCFFLMALMHHSLTHNFLLRNNLLPFLDVSFEKFSNVKCDSFFIVECFREYFNFYSW